MVQVFISSDHRGYAARQQLVQGWTEILGPDLAPDFPLIDLGPDTYDPDDDFNDAVISVCSKVLSAQTGDRSVENSPSPAGGPRVRLASVASSTSDKTTSLVDSDFPSAFGLLLCGSAHGICMGANRFGGIRAICGYTPELARLGREHNDANVLCLSADLTDHQHFSDIIRIFLTTPFLAEPRFLRRNHRLDTDVIDQSKINDTSDINPAVTTEKEYN